MALIDSSPISFTAGGDLTGKRWHFGKTTATGVVACDTAGERAHLIIGTEAKARGQPLDGYRERRPKVVAGGLFARGQDLTTDAQGRAVLAQAGQHVNAIADADGVEHRVVEVLPTWT